MRVLAQKAETLKRVGSLPALQPTRSSGHDFEAGEEQRALRLLESMMLDVTATHLVRGALHGNLTTRQAGMPPVVRVRQDKATSGLCRSSAGWDKTGAYTVRGQRELVAAAGEPSDQRSYRGWNRWAEMNPAGKNQDENSGLPAASLIFELNRKLAGDRRMDKLHIPGVPPGAVGCNLPAVVTLPFADKRENCHTPV
ncbi:hypothetical protein LTR56_001951 [Elasticomyces elasticus]|nr:hypothetical protein LTR22_011537 [Elasticomyces elasticus]KAK3658095.1 hypothetical protein LTR56_001951 [Elasticomyces elasticus]KAK4914918.1 hypothetical protein LTR49_016907 [Elasticomyces elasticus]KAK5749107.1 hypothetical protein LTS12_020802 [Elasticomyces elasticus]